MICHYAVFACDRHNVGCYAHGHKVKKRFKFVMIGEPVAQGKGLHEFKTYSTSRQVRTRIGGTWHLRVKYCHCRRQNLVRHMMVAYDEVYAFFFSISNFIDCLNAAVEHDYKFYVVFCSIFDAFKRYSISFFISCGYVIFDIAVVILQVFID